MTLEINFVAVTLTRLYDESGLYLYKVGSK